MRVLPCAFASILILLMSAAVYAADSAPAAFHPSYPLTTCVVSGDKLGAMNSPVIINSHGTEVRFCCHDCVESFRQNPAKYLAKLNASAQK